MKSSLPFCALDYTDPLLYLSIQKCFFAKLRDQPIEGQFSRKISLYYQNSTQTSMIQVMSLKIQVKHTESRRGKVWVQFIIEHNTLKMARSNNGQRDHSLKR